MQRVESWGLTSKGQKTADEPLKQGETRRKPCPVKDREKRKKKMKRYYAQIENGKLLYSEYSDDLKGLLFEMGMRAIDFIFDKGKENCELFTLQIYDAEKHENAYYTTICNVHGSIETVAERTARK